MRRDVIGDEDLRRLADRRSHRMVVVLIKPRQATVGHALERPHRTMTGWHERVAAHRVRPTQGPDPAGRRSLVRDHRSAGCLLAMAPREPHRFEGGRTPRPALSEEER
jgi:hypothetical protein